MSASPKIAYLAEGKLYLHDGGPSDAPRLVESPFVQGILDRVERSRERNDWKNQGMGWNVRAGGFMGLPGMGGAGPGGAPAETRRVRFTGVAAGGAGRLLYALDTDHVGGLFCRDLAEDHERRLMHRQQFRARDVTRRASDGMLALSLHREDGTAHLAVISEEGRGLREVTEGDAVDEAPSWSDDDARTLLFQSAGIGRNAAGFAAALGPYAVQALDLDAGRVTTLVEDEAHDHLQPRRAAGALYFIRRPYQPGGQPVSPGRVALDVLLFPFRLARAVVHFLNFMSIMFSRKPLITAAGPPKEGPDQRYVMLWGKVIDAERILKRGRRRPGGNDALVPKDWQLVRRPLGGADGAVGDGTGGERGGDGAGADAAAGAAAEQVLAQGVVAFDVAADGRVVYTNGSRVFQLDPAGGPSAASGKSAAAAATPEPRELTRGNLIERVAFVD